MHQALVPGRPLQTNANITVRRPGVGGVGSNAPIVWQGPAYIMPAGTAAMSSRPDLRTPAAADLSTPGHFYFFIYDSNAQIAKRDDVTGYVPKGITPTPTLPSFEVVHVADWTQGDIHIEGVMRLRGQ